MNALAVHSSNAWHDLSNLCSDAAGLQSEDCDWLATEVAGALAVGASVSFSALSVWAPMAKHASFLASWLSSLFSPSAAGLAAAATSAVAATPAAFYLAAGGVVASEAAAATTVAIVGVAVIAFAAAGAGEAALVALAAGVVTAGVFSMFAVMEALGAIIAGAVAALAMAMISLFVAVSLVCVLIACLGTAAATRQASTNHDVAAVSSEAAVAAAPIAIGQPVVGAAPAAETAGSHESDEWIDVGASDERPRARLYPEPLVDDGTESYVVPAGLPVSSS